MTLRWKQVDVSPGTVRLEPGTTGAGDWNRTSDLRCKKVRSRPCSGLLELTGANEYQAVREKRILAGMGLSELK